MPALPAVSIVVPVFERFGLLRKAIASVIAQSFDDWELVIVDDGSESSVQRLLDEFSDSRIRLVSLRHSGNAARVRNAGIAAARGEMVAFLDSDDAWHPGKLSRQTAALAADPACGWSCTAVAFIDDNDQPIAQRAGPAYRARSGWVLESLLDETLATTMPTLLVRTDVLRSLGGFDEAFLNRGDRDISLRLAARSQLCALPDPLTLVREHTRRSTAEVRRSRLHYFNELVYRRALAIVANARQRRICRRRCALELLARARLYSRDGARRAAAACIVRSLRDWPLHWEAVHTSAHWLVCAVAGRGR